jgi:hypothetical protein
VDADLRRHDDGIGRAHYQAIRLFLGVALEPTECRSDVGLGETLPICVFCGSTVFHLNRRERYIAQQERNPA